MNASRLYDTVIIGGGPAGLTAAIYLGRFLRDVVLIDAGESRAALIPTSHNYPGFAKGVSGHDFLKTLRDQLAAYAVQTVQDSALSLAQAEDKSFIINTAHDEFRARTVVLATGAVDNTPALPYTKSLIYNGVVRYCPICDGYEARDKRVGIIGPSSKIYKKALFLRTYTQHLYLLPTDENFLCDEDDVRKLSSLDIRLPSSAVDDLITREDGVTVTLKDGTTADLDILYPAMGSRIRTELAAPFGICQQDGCIETDRHQQTKVPGLYAIGDITFDLSQLSVATGQAAIAATAIHTSLPRNPTPTRFP